MLRLTARIVSLLAISIGANQAIQGQNPPAQASRAEIHETYDLSPGGTVSVSNVSGYIRVTSWDENRVRVDAVKRTNRKEDIDQVEIQINANPGSPGSPGSLVIRTVFPRRGVEGRVRASDVDVYYDIKVPRSALLNTLVNVSGEVKVTGPVAQVTARSVSGSIDVRDVRGATSLSSSSGSITARNAGDATSETVIISHSGAIVLEQLAGRVSARSLAGSVSITEAAGDVVADSTSGSVTVERVRGRVNASSVAGNVVIRNAPEGVNARTVGGSVEIIDAKGRIVANTMSGGISLRGVSSREVQAKSTSGGVSFDGPLSTDGRYSFETFSGMIVVVIPAESQFSLTAKTYNGSINTEFPIKIEPGGVGGDRQIRGVAGSGGADIIATGFNGRIEIKKAKPSSR